LCCNTGVTIELFFLQACLRVPCSCQNGLLYFSRALAKLKRKLSQMQQTAQCSTYTSCSRNERWQYGIFINGQIVLTLIWIFYSLHPAQFINRFCVVALRINSKLCPTQHSVIGSYNRDGKCLLRCTLSTTWFFYLSLASNCM
jgi:hypothetical protein